MIQCIALLGFALLTTLPGVCQAGSYVQDFTQNDNVHNDHSIEVDRPATASWGSRRTSSRSALPHRPEPAALDRL